MRCVTLTSPPPRGLSQTAHPGDRAATAPSRHHARHAYPSRYGETIRCLAVFQTDGDLPGIASAGAAYGPSIEADDHAPNTRNATPPSVVGRVAGLAAERGSPRDRAVVRCGRFRGSGPGPRPAMATRRREATGIRPESSLRVRPEFAELEPRTQLSVQSRRPRWPGEIVCADDPYGTDSLGYSYRATQWLVDEPSAMCTPSLE
jgi:hypothetical protein